MNINLYNTLTREKEEFSPLSKGEVSMYHCGPTVYDYAHVGNLRSFLLADILRRMFEFGDFRVKQVMNVTDVDDKTIRRSREEGVGLKELTKKYEKAFLEDIAALNIKRPGLMPRASESVFLMIDLVQKLLEKEFAYKGEDGIYFSIGKDKSYGKLAGVSPGRETKSRIKNDEYDKENPQDFALWKFRAEEDGEVFWEAPFGSGRPGWHIECSAMAMDALGETFDIHTGGVDLIFPHHENEIAQSESATGKKFVHYWVHNNFMLVDGKKMSKSLGNIITLRDVKNKGFSPLACRYFLLMSHYRTLANFTYEALSAAENALEKLYDMAAELPGGGLPAATSTAQAGKIDLAYKAEFENFIGDDLDTPKALALTWELTRDEEVTPADKKATLLLFDRVLGLKLDEARAEEIPEDIKKLAQKREAARQAKNWRLADEIRRNMEARGYEVRDTEEGYKVKSLKAKDKR